ncbi:Malic enzyme, NAD-binding [Artemisia annua]|uniref:Malic enzyme, NAD-binding n=1 Tax=Artemisia annua TaxID=35608 RepID=A0A2U1KJY2_ARTAN|nr:Malic enzyme, NAD-binding [Artemisia annua]
MWRRSVVRCVKVAENVGTLRMFGVVASTSTVPSPCIVRKRGADILHDPWFNKGLINCDDCVSY